MLHSTDVLESAHRRMVDAHPDGRATIDRWFDTHRNRLLPLATALVKQSARSPERFTASTDQGERVVAELLDRLHALPDLQAWAHKYAEILKLLVRSIVGSLGQAKELADEPASTGPLPTDWPRTAGERLAANVTAIRIVASGRTPTEAERGALLRYTGNGGLSLERLAEQVPAEWIPDSKALVDEYFTPPALAVALAALLVAIVPLSTLSGPALEPSAGIGRFLGAFAARPEMAGLSWFAVEYSRLSAEICRLLYPFAQVFNQPFEQWLVDTYNQIAGTLALVVTNPPYGKRGANKTIDPDKDYREEIAYLYFIRRAFDLLRPCGVGIALVPGGFLTNPTGPVARARERVLLRHHLLCAYRLPSAHLSRGQCHY
jgi:predicted RNA methylase